MRVAIFTDSFLPGVGGTEKACLGLADALVRQGHEVVVCCPKYKGKYDDNYSFRVLRTKSIKLTDNDYLALPYISGNFKKELKKFNPEIVHCQSVSPMTAYAIKYAKKHNLPILMTVHTKFKMAFERSIKSKVIVNYLIKNLVKKLNRANGIYTVCYDMINELQSYGYKGKITVIRNGAVFERIPDVDALKPLAQEKYGLTEQDNILSFVGHIVKFKNLEFICNALKIVKDKGYKFKMLFIGHGFDDEYFTKLAEKLGISDNVIFTGQITDKQLLSSLYSVSNLFLFPSFFDNDPLTIVEAALHKVPALTLKGSGSSERITDGVSGYIIENNVEEYANKIIHLIQNKDQAKIAGEQAELLIPKLWEQTACEYLNEYQLLLKGN